MVDGATLEYPFHLPSTPLHLPAKQIIVPLILPYSRTEMSIPGHETMGVTHSHLFVPATTGVIYFH